MTFVFVLSNSYNSRQRNSCLGFSICCGWQSEPTLLLSVPATFWPGCCFQTEALDFVKLCEGNNWLAPGLRSQPCLQRCTQLSFLTVEHDKNLFFQSPSNCNQTQISLWWGKHRDVWSWPFLSFSYNEQLSWGKSHCFEETLCRITGSYYIRCSLQH